MTTAYVLVTDLHCHYQDKENRFSYSREIDYVFEYLESILSGYQARGFKVIIIFMGDIFDNGYRETVSGIQVNNRFIVLRNLCDAIYTVLGNHEVSYPKNNPFYTLVTEFNSEKIHGLRGKSIEPLGIFPVIDVVDRLEDGDIVFHFNHFATSVSEPEQGKINIGLFHQEIVCNEILQEMEQKFKGKLYGTKPLDFESSTLAGYDHCFFGHIHKVYGKWDWVNESTGKLCTLNYLASLGRPNVTEVMDSFLDRNIPAVIMEDGKFQRIEDNVFQLMTYSQCVKENVVQHQHEQYQYVKERQVLRNYDPLSDVPIDNIFLRCTTDEERNLLRELLDGKDSMIESSLHDRYQTLCD